MRKSSHYFWWRTQTGVASPSTATVASEAAVLLRIPHATVKDILAKFMPLGDPSTDEAAAAAATAALRRCQQLSGLTDEDLRRALPPLTQPYKLCSGPVTNRRTENAWISAAFCFPLVRVAMNLQECNHL